MWRMNSPPSEMSHFNHAAWCRSETVLKLINSLWSDNQIWNVCNAPTPSCHHQHREVCLRTAFISLHGWINDRFILQKKRRHQTELISDYYVREYVDVSRLPHMLFNISKIIQKIMYIIKTSTVSAMYIKPSYTVVRLCWCSTLKKREGRLSARTLTRLNTTYGTYSRLHIIYSTIFGRGFEK